MTTSTASLRRKIASAGDLLSVVRTMKALAASNIGQYERSVMALVDYADSVDLGLSVCFQQMPMPVQSDVKKAGAAGTVGAVVFGSDQGLVGRFNDVVADYALEQLAALPGKARVWAVGERVHSRLVDAGAPVAARFTVPGSVKAIAPLVGEILVDTEPRDGHTALRELYLFHNRPGSGAIYEPAAQRLLPLDETWLQHLATLPWPAKGLPTVLGDVENALRAFIREYLFVSLFRACAESLASENASRLAAMQRAEKNISEMLEDLDGAFHRLRQSGIDEELFDVIFGFEASGEEAW